MKWKSCVSSDLEHLQAVITYATKLYLVKDNTV